VVTSAQVENYIAEKSGKDLSKIFDQYLRTVRIPVLEYRQAGNKVQYRWNNTVAGFAMPVKTSGGSWLKPTAQWQSLTVKGGETFDVDKNFYINLKKL
jgi:aminopeptidase N